MSDSLRTLSVGKHLPGAVYVHRSLLPVLPPEHARRVEALRQQVGLPEDGFDVVKFTHAEDRLSLLAYPGFWDEGFPVLGCSWSSSNAALPPTVRDYRGHWNPPVLHRKELLLAPDDERRRVFENLTRSAEEAGLFDDPSAIGQLLQWRETLRAKKLRVLGHELVPDDGELDAREEPVLRHRTALRRTGLSTPMQALLRHGFLDGGHSLFDYGCGHGDDLATLDEMGLAAAGWDPHFRPDAERLESDVVNLGFVLNVIENITERREALVRAYALARKLLVVGVLIGGRTAYERYRLYRDGVLTSRGTFQKYFTPDELHSYLEAVCGRQPIPVAPGVAFVFRNNEDEQAFLAARQSVSPTWLRASPRRPPRAPLTDAAPRVRTPRVAKPKTPSKWEAARPIWMAFHEAAVTLGRIPESDEYPDYAAVAGLGRPETVLRKALEALGDVSFNQTRRVRMDDLLVYLALNLFERRKSFGDLPKAVKRDIKAFWGSYASATDEAKGLLFSVGKPESLVVAARVASNEGHGYLAEDDAFYFVPDVLNRLPRELRTFVGCASRLYGDPSEADLVKVHSRTLKLTLQSYDDFDESPLPTLIERIKIDLRLQDILFVDYSARSDEQVLFDKARYLPRDVPGRPTQEAIDARFRGLPYLNLTGFGPTKQELLRLLAEHGDSMDTLTRIET